MRTHARAHTHTLPLLTAGAREGRADTGGRWGRKEPSPAAGADSSKERKAAAAAQQAADAEDGWETAGAKKKGASSRAPEPQPRARERQPPRAEKPGGRW